MPRKRKAPRRIETGEGDAYHSPTVEIYYRRIYFETLDLATTSITDRFNQPGCVILQNLEEQLLKAANAEDYSSHLKVVIDFYGDDINMSDLSTQLEILSSNFPKNERECWAQRYFGIP